MNTVGRLGLVFLTVLLVACSQAAGASPTPIPPSPSPAPSPTPTPVAPVGLTGRTFVSQSVALNGADFPLVPNTQIRLVFDGANGFSANASCNTIGGTYRIDGDKLVLDGAGMTEMGCDEPRMRQDDWLVGILGSTPRFTLVGDALTLFSGDTTIDLLDREVAQPDQALAGPTWILNSIFNAEVASSIPVGVSAPLAFKDDGTFTFNDGCNSGGGKYLVDGDQISFGDVVQTDMACGGAAGQVEQAVLSVIGSPGAIHFEIDADSLTLTAGTFGLQYSATHE